MKFLCDRCKTRYSIADERVRGKILKIRCKNCANVITVREGMEEPAVEAKVPMASRSGQRAAIAPGAGLAGKPLEAAFASAMSSPGISVPPAAPAALEEEWYVSIDGDQSGPFSLTQAQGWIAGRGADDDLYCWSEGFDDWLPVEKVSHFRGLRGRSRPRTEPPPMPTDSGRHLRPGPEPDQPLFAATLAALEAEAPTSIGSPPLKLDDLMPSRHPSRADAKNGRPVTPVPALPAPSNGRASLPKPLPTPTSMPRAGAPPLPGAGANKVPTGPTMSAVSATSSPGLARVATPAGQSAPAPVATPAPMFGKGPAPANGANGANGYEARPESRPMFDNAGLDDGNDTGDALSRGASRGGGGATDDDDEADDLAIGEVSRVVRIADLRPSSMQIPVARRTPQSSAVARGTGAVQKFEQAALAASGDGLAAMPIPMPLTGTESELVQQLAQPPPAPHRHTLLLALGVGFVALIATLVIVFVARGGSDDDSLGPSLDTSEGDLEGIGMAVTVTIMPQPKDPTTNVGSGGNTGNTGKTGGNTGKTGGNTGKTGGNTGGNSGGNSGKSEAGGLSALSGDDVVAMSQKMSTGPRRCYEQAKRKDPFLDVKRLRAVITVDKSGSVTRVELIDHANGHLDTCLSGAISRWKFRENSEGLTSQVSFAFMSS